MNALRFTFNTLESDEFFNSLAGVLATTPISNMIKVPEEMGKGSITRRVIEDKLVLLTWDVTLNKNIFYDKKASEDHSASQSFLIVYLLNSSSVLMNSPGVSQQFNLRGVRNNLFISNSAELKVEIPSGEKLKAVLITVPLYWLKSAFDGAGEAFDEFLNKMGSSESPTIFMENSSPPEYKVVSELSEHSYDGEHSTLYYKSRVYSLIVDFFHKVFRHDGKDLLDSKVLHYETMKEVELFLKDHLEKTLPDINTIAKRMALSISTLKRHFKVIYNKSIYDYYLELKMDHALKLLSERPLSVNEVAAMLDYEKVSSFIEMFKKHHGVSPGSLRKKSA
jgi:AraC-like DNA-binding protein